MASYLQGWLPNPASFFPLSQPTPKVLESSPPASDDDEGEDTETEADHDDSPPAFPALNSAQRASSSSPSTTSNIKAEKVIPKVLTDAELMPPPPLPSLARRSPGVPSNVQPGPSSSSLLSPMHTIKPPAKPQKKGKKVALAPGHSPLDWAALKSSGEDLRGVDNLARIPPSVLKQHNKRHDAWSAFNGKVYNITPYLPFHPGGQGELMRVAGRDGTQLFAATHAWVNVDFMLDACLVGFLISEPSS